MKREYLVFWSIAAFCWVGSVPSLRAHIAEFDEYWQRRAEEAKAVAQAAYVANPLEVINDVNLLVKKATEGSNGTRRELKKYFGPCIASNPIDQCWRCQKNWATDRKRLAKCAIGFGRKTTGGLDGEIYVVTDGSDEDLINPKPGTLRYAVTRKESLWITFAHSMIIRLQQELLVTSNKTIDGRGAQVRICYGAGITLQFVHNVIIHGIHIHDIEDTEGGEIMDYANHVGLRTKADGDGISIFGSSNLWLDHLSMSVCKDGLIDAIMGSTAITISNSRFTHHNDVMLLGANDAHSGDTIMQVTLAFNCFGKGLVQRMPRCRWGFTHVVNNDYTHWLMYAIGGTKSPTIICQGNRFVAPENAVTKEITKRDFAPESEWKNWMWKSQNDLMVNGAHFLESGPPFDNTKFQIGDLIEAKPGTFVTQLTRMSGALDCVPGREC